MTIAHEITSTEPQAPGNAGTPGGTAPQSPASGIATPTTPASVAPAAPRFAAPEDPTARLAKLETDTLPKLQTERDTLRTERDTLKATVADLTAQLEETPDEEQLRFEVAHERDGQYLSWLQKALREGRTLAQVVARAEADNASAATNRNTHETRRQNIEGQIALIEEFDKGFGAFLRKLDANGTTIDQSTIPGLKTLYASLNAGKTPEQAIAAATAAAPGAGGSEPPTVPAAAGSGMSDTPVYQPHMTTADYFRMALKGAWGRDRERAQKG